MTLGAGTLFASPSDGRLKASDLRVGVRVGVRVRSRVKFRVLGNTSLVLIEQAN